MIDNIKPKDCNSLEDIRKEIDFIDNEIIKYLDLRSKYVSRASLYKTNLNTVKAEKRVEKMITSRKIAASKTNLDLFFVEKLFRNIVGYFINKEKDKWLIENIFDIEKIKIEKANENDLKEIFNLQNKAYESEGILYESFNIEPLNYSFDDIRDEFNRKTFFKVVFENKIVASFRSYKEENTCCIEKLVVEPSYQNLGLGKYMLNYAERYYDNVEIFLLYTGSKSEKNLRLYKNQGYQVYKTKKINDKLTMIYLVKKIKK